MWSNRRLTASSGEVKAVLLRVDSEQPVKARGPRGFEPGSAARVSAAELCEWTAVCVLLQEREGRCVCRKKGLCQCMCVLVHPCDAHMRALAFLCPCCCVYPGTALLSAAGMFSLSDASTDQRGEQTL